MSSPALTQSGHAEALTRAALHGAGRRVRLRAVMPRPPASASSIARTQAIMTATVIISMALTPLW